MQAAEPFTVHETHGILSRPENKIRAASDRFGWSSLYASAQREIPYEGYFPAVKDQLIVQHLDGPVPIDRLHGPNPARCLVPAGGLHLVPGGLDFGVRLMGALSTLHVYVRRHVVEEVAAELIDGDPQHVEIPPQFLAPDPAISSLMDAIRIALDEDDYGSSIYVDYLALYKPGMLDDILGGVVHEFDAGPTFVALALIGLADDDEDHRIVERVVVVVGAGRHGGLLSGQ